MVHASTVLIILALVLHNCIFASQHVMTDHVVALILDFIFTYLLSYCSAFHGTK